jgi:hypothetical protein
MGRRQQAEVGRPAGLGHVVHPQVRPAGAAGRAGRSLAARRGTALRRQAEAAQAGAQPAAERAEEAQVGAQPVAERAEEVQADGRPAAEGAAAAQADGQPAEEVVEGAQADGQPVAEAVQAGAQPVAERAEEVQADGQPAEEAEGAQAGAQPAAAQADEPPAALRRAAEAWRRAAGRVEAVSDRAVRRPGRAAQPAPAPTIWRPRPRPAGTRPDRRTEGSWRRTRSCPPEVAHVPWASGTRLLFRCKGPESSARGMRNLEHENVPTAAPSHPRPQKLTPNGPGERPCRGCSRILRPLELNNRQTAGGTMNGGRHRRGATGHGRGCRRGRARLSRRRRR